MTSISLQDAQTQDWDAIVIGTGMGGGILGRRLAEQGVTVLFVEKGREGYSTEQQGLCEIQEPRARLLRGAWPKPAEYRPQGGEGIRFFGPYGSGVGGSSVFYAAALERPERHDLDDDPALSHPTGGWPVGYDEFRPFFDSASELLHLCGTPDPLSSEPSPASLHPPLPISEGDAALMTEMEQRGLHPYRLHLAVRDPDNCRQCFGRKCPWGCKMDGRSAGVSPALTTGKAQLLAECEILEVLEDGSRVTGLRASKDGQEIVLSAKIYALCAGSLGSARLLLASSRTNPDGCANSSGLVGRGLMFHLNEIFVLWPRGQHKKSVTFRKSISLRDIYSVNGQRFGLVQSMGMEVEYGNIVHYLGQIYDQSFLRHSRQFRGLLRIPAMLISRLFGRAAVFVGMMEDFPYDENRVVLNDADPDILTFEYTFHEELLARRRRFRKALLQAFKGHKRFMVSLQPVLNFGHPVGTLRFGTNPSRSVLRPDCRTHDLDNLYVGDGSFMPSALGVNPSLTIAANALRVADHMVQAVDKSGGAFRASEKRTPSQSCRGDRGRSWVGTGTGT